MKGSRILGGLLLVITLLNVGPWIDVMLGITWTSVIEVLAWVLLFLGGIAYLRRDPRARIPTMAGVLLALFATALSLVTGESTLAPAEILISVLPMLLIIGAVLFVSRSRPAEPAEPGVSRASPQDFAYGSFIALGLISLYTGLLLSVAGNEDSMYAALGLAVIVPFGIPVLVALYFGPIRAMFPPRDDRLLILTGLSVVLLGALVVASIQAWPGILIVYAIVCIASGFYWFVKLRGN